MRLMCFRAEGRDGWGVVEGDAVVDLSGRAPGLRAALPRLTELTQPDLSLPHVPLSGLTYLPPIPDPQRILCVGLNYLSHIKEGGRDIPKRPTIFTRWASSQVGHNQPMIRPRVSHTLDYEGELAVVIGRPCRHVPESEAHSVIAGYSCYNDGSVREWQRHSAQFTPGKNFPGTGGFGPYLVTPDEAGDVGNTTLVTRLNGEIVQQATTDDLLFGIPALIAYCSTFTPLDAGDVIITGTTGGVGEHRHPPLWLKPGDVVEVEIGGVGLLRNPVTQED